MTDPMILVLLLLLGILLILFVLYMGRMAFRHDKASSSTKTKKRSPQPSDTVSMNGIERLIEEGRIDEAVEIYRTVTGIDEYAARDAIARLREQKMR